MKQAHVLPNMMTAFGLFCGLFVIFKVSTAPAGVNIYDLIFSSSILLIIAMAADVLDGAIARAMHAESEFGLMFDSLADAVSFGVAPSVLFLKSVTLEQGSSLAFFAFIAAMFYSICGILRLVRYNVKAGELKGDQLAMMAYKKNFTGLPIPAGASCALSLILLMNTPWIGARIEGYPWAKIVVIGIGMIIAGSLMISKCKFMALKALRVKIDSFVLVLVTVVIAIFVLYGVLHHFSWVFASVSWGYLFLGCILTLIRLIAGKKSKALKDFDPDDEQD